MKLEFDLMILKCHRRVNKDSFETQVPIQHNMALMDDFFNEFLYNLHHFICGVLEVTEVRLS